MQVPVLRERRLRHVPLRASALSAWSLTSRGLTGYRVRYSAGGLPCEAQAEDEASALALAMARGGIAERLYLAVTATEVLADYRPGAAAGTLGA